MKDMDVIKELAIVVIFGVVLIALFQIGMSGGQTIGAAAGTRNSCSDSDKGIVTNYRGVVRAMIDGVSYSKNDVCSTDNLYIEEQFCNNGIPDSVFIQCINYCINGACK